MNSSKWRVFSGKLEIAETCTNSETRRMSSLQWYTKYRWYSLYAPESTQRLTSPEQTPRKLNSSNRLSTIHKCFMNCFFNMPRKRIDSITVVGHSFIDTPWRGLQKVVFKNQNCIPRLPNNQVDSETHKYTSIANQMWAKTLMGISIAIFIHSYLYWWKRSLSFCRSHPKCRHNQLPWTPSRFMSHEIHLKHEIRLATNWSH